ncbi:MAG: branched-chain amino acid ABC transporter permease [Chloroflexi bacterium]|nr:branched-chain amino acid ABC transporter permease [Chloroflexota bacterium]
MMKIIRPGITFGIIGGLLTFLFGGWSVAVIGCFMGLGLGLGLAGQFERKNPLELVKSALPTALIAGVILVLLSLYQSSVVQEAIGKRPTAEEIVAKGNLIGFLGAVGFSLLLVALHSLPEKQEQQWKIAVLALVVITFPFVDQASELRWTSQIIFALIFVILGLGLNIVVGYAGLLDLGYAAFFAIGAYTTGILSSPVHNIQWNFWLVIWIAAAMAAIWGLILGAPTLPLRGDYLAIVTLGFGEIVPVLFKNLIDVTIKEPLTCWILPMFGANTTCIVFTEHFDATLGEKGISPIGRPALPLIAHGEPAGAAMTIKIVIMLVAIAILGYLFWRAWSSGNRKPGVMAGFAGALAAIFIFFLPIPRTNNTIIDSVLGIIQPGEFESSRPVTWYFLIIGIILLSIFIIRRLRDSRLGRAWMAIREDELAAAQMGIDPVKTKLLAFAMGATFSGFAGAFYAAYIRGIFPSVFDFSASIIILCVVILGGIGNINGVIVGGLVLMTADRLFLPALKDFLAAFLKTTILPSISDPAVQLAVKDNANPILYRFLLFGLTLAIMMAVRPEGLIPNEQIRAELHEKEAVAEVEAPKSKKGKKG